MREGKYLKEDGSRCERDDLERLIWHSAGCTYWTDDWSKLSKAENGIPCCPRCRCVGFQQEAREWFQGVDDLAEHVPEYNTLVLAVKEMCAPHEMFARFIDTSKGR